MSAETLIHRYLDDRSGLNEAELDELIALLKAEPARAVALREQLLLEDLLAQKLSVDRKNFPAQVGQRLADYHRGQEEMDNQVSDLRALAESEFERPTTWSGSSPWVKYIALAATVLIAAVLFVPRFLPKAPQAVAKVTAVEGDVQVAGAPAVAVGLALMTGQQIVTPAGGTLSLAYADTTTLRIAGDSTVALNLDEATGGKRIMLERGAIIANVAKQDPEAPLVIVTPHAVATVVGTQFRLTVTGEQTLLDVTQGVVLLDRLEEGEPIAVKANETGLAAGERLQLRPVAWPDDRASVVYIYSPFDFLNLAAPVSASRDLESGTLFDTEYKTISSAAVNEFTAAIELSGGYWQSDEAGLDLSKSVSGKSELTFEVVLSAAKPKQSGAARIVALADDGSNANLVLAQDGSDLLFRLQTAADQPPRELRFSAGDLKVPVHIAATYREGVLTVYRDGVEVKTSKGAANELAWRDGPLTLGADASGMTSWQGTIEALAIHQHCLESEEIARNARAFRLLSGKNAK